MSENAKIKRIVEKIDESDLEENMKKFLKEIFKLELPRIDQKRSIYTEDYKKIIGKYVKKEEQQ